MCVHIGSETYLHGNPNSIKCRWTNKSGLWLEKNCCRTVLGLLETHCPAYGWPIIRKYGCSLLNILRRVSWGKREQTHEYSQKNKREQTRRATQRDMGVTPGPKTKQSALISKLRTLQTVTLSHKLPPLFKQHLFIF